MISGDKVWIAGDTADAISQATPLAQMALGQPLTYSTADMFWGFIPGSVGETSAFCILIGAVILLLTNVASWRTMISVLSEVISWRSYSSRFPVSKPISNC